MKSVLLSRRISLLRLFIRNNVQQVRKKENKEKKRKGYEFYTVMYGRFCCTYVKLGKY